MRSLRLGVSYVCVSLASMAGAQETVESFALERLVLDPSGRGGLLLFDGRVLEPGRFRMMAGGQYERSPLRAWRSSTWVADLVRDRWTVQVGGAWSFARRWEVGASLAVVAHQEGAGQQEAALSAAAVGSPYLFGRYALFQGESFDLGAHLGVGIPVGGNSFVSERTFSVSPRVAAGYTAGWFRFSGQLGATVRGASTVAQSTVGSELEGDLGVHTVAEHLRFEVALRTAVSLLTAPPALEVLAGARYLFSSGLEVYALGGPGLSRAPGVPSYRLMAGLGFAPGAKPSGLLAQAEPKPEPKDLDGDGLVEADACPNQPEDMDGFQDADGCPEPDNDADGIADARDACPNTAARGTEDGCPRLDGDGDGLADAQDACPTQAGPTELQGCPVQDTDGDAIVDRFDNCPTVPGPATNQGCPLAKKQWISIRETGLEVRQKIFFLSGSARLDPRSYPLLRQVAEVLVAHPELSRIEVAGHTDDRGDLVANIKLSQARAHSVAEYLGSVGVASERLVPLGYGPSRR